MDTDYQALKGRLQEVHALNKAAEILEWDQQVFMPRGGGPARMEQFGTLRRIAHEKFIAPEVGRLIEALGRGAAAAYDSDEAALLRWASREYEQKRRLPAALVEEFARHTSLAQDVWVEARAKDDFVLFQPALEEMVELRRRQAEALGSCDDAYDAWLCEFEPGMTTADLDSLFADLKTGLIPLVKAVSAKSGAVDDSPLRQRFDVARQRAFGEEVARAIGFDFDRGRQDLAAHPFSTSFSPDDVRITTRFNESHATSALFGTMHEAGHGMYEQNVGESLKNTPLCAGATMGVHESQSRLWENVVGRSRGFWKRFYPRFCELFPQVDAMGPEAFYRAVNKAGPSFIRVEADELTYSLHILLRFELERDLLAGRLKAADVPEAWNAKMSSYLGITPPDHRRGSLQDVHWAAGLFGYFPTYALGNLISLQLYEAALQARPEIPAQTESGEFSALRGWLKEHIHRHGKKYTAPELVLRATGRPIEAAPFLRYLRAKYGELYALPDIWLNSG